MQLPPKTKIAGRKNVSDWNALKPLLCDFSNGNAWECAYRDFFLKRLEDRYFKPLDIIIHNGKNAGEGFSIMAIICSLIEFLESTYQGINYRLWKKGDPVLGKFEYGESSKIFISFLTTHAPFNTEFNTTDAKDFYRNVRCGLLHEARTKGRWIIKTTRTSKRVFENRIPMMVIYRDNFYKAINTYICDYHGEVLSSNDRKEAFIRKFDSICDE